MAGLGTGKKIINAQTTDARAGYIQARATRLNWTKTKAVTRIVEMWFESGCPPLSHPDMLLPKLPFPLESGVKESSSPENAPHAAAARY